MSQHNPFDSKRGKALRIESAADFIAVFIATGFGAGFIPFAPGTCGSIVGLLIAYVLIAVFSSDALALQNILIVAGLVSAALGVWASNRAEKIFDRKDASQIVIDEVFGQIITFVLIAPYLAGPHLAGPHLAGPHLAETDANWRWRLVAGFALFRAFDIFKPYPINRLQGLSGGLGVMMDDALAGIYAAVALSLLSLASGY